MMKTFVPIVTLAALLTGLNAVKPLHVDDTTYYFDAAQIAAHPLDPYGHVLLYFSDPLPALHVLAPPVLPYWWATALRLFGERPLLWKLWLFPFALLFTASLAGLLRRFAPTTATPLLIALVLSPVFLPSLNLMIDIPALALSLAALALFMRACDGDSPALAVLAGLTAGMAMQTKYTALLAPPIMLIYALHRGKLRLGLAAALAAGLLFAAWETALVCASANRILFTSFSTATTAIGPNSCCWGACFPFWAAPLRHWAYWRWRCCRRRVGCCSSLPCLRPFLLFFWFVRMRSVSVGGCTDWPMLSLLAMERLCC